MSALDAEEIRARLDAIQDGPWAQRAADARKTIAAPASTIDPEQVDLMRDLRQFRIGPPLTQRLRRLEVTLRPHSSNHIPTDRDQEIRDSFDNALDQLELMELAIETGYLPAEAALPLARADLISYLWSAPARRFVDHYEYAGIESLAERAGLRGLRPAQPRQIDTTGAPHFAAFLATHRAIEDHKPTQTWLEFLDDYVIRGDEQESFYEFLESGEPASSKRRLMLVTGAHHFARALSDFLQSVPTPLKVRFARFYLYWLAKLFGYERASEGSAYTRNTDRWGASADDCWARAIDQWYTLRAEREEDPAAAALSSSLKSANNLLRDVWGTLRRPLVTDLRIQTPDFDALS